MWNSIKVSWPLATLVKMRQFSPCHALSSNFESSQTQNLYTIDFELLNFTLNNGFHFMLQSFDFENFE